MGCFGSCENLTEVDVRACIGVSNVSLEQLKQYNALGDVEFIQNRFSLLDRSIDDKFARYLVDNNIGLVAY